MDCIDIKDLLFPFFEGNLEEEKKILVEKHLSECKRCSLEYELVVSIENTLKTAEKVEAPDYLKDRILSKIYPAFESKKEKLELGILSIAWAVVSMIIALIYIPYEKLGPMIIGLFSRFQNDIVNFEAKIKEAFTIISSADFSYMVGFVVLFMVLSIIIFSVEFIIYQRS